MKNDESVWIDVSLLRLGHYVELDVGWMAHPFPTNGFKIISEKQLQAVRALGLTQVRYLPSRSDPMPPTPGPGDQLLATDVAGAVQVPDPASLEQERRRLHAATLSAHERRLVECERRFVESARLYRRTMDLVLSDPLEAAAQCLEMVTSYVNDILDHGETAIQLLTEISGDKSTMHAVNVTVISLLLGKAMGLSRSELTDLGMGAFLHDIGKAKLPDRVRWPEESLTSAEYRVYQEHVALGLEIANGMRLNFPAQLAMQHHHELLDGSGFPNRLRDESLSLGGRILALVNRYDNLCNPHRPSAALTPHESLSLIFAQYRSRFDPATLSAFIRMMGVYPPGSVVQLNDERYAIVQSVNSARPLKPRVMVYDPAVPRYEALVLDLEKHSQLGISKSVKPAVLAAPVSEYLAPRQRVAYFYDRMSEGES